MATAARTAPKASAWLYARRQRPAGQSPIRYVASPRYTLEVEHFSYGRELEQLVSAPRPPPPGSRAAAVICLALTDERIA